jgi:NarL family two-component system response regulator LiaR
MTGEPVRIAIVNDYEVVVEGLAVMLAPYDDRVRVVETDANEPVASDVDIALYDNFAQTHRRDLDVADLLAHSRARRLVIFSWHLDPTLVRRAIDAGARGYLTKGLDAAGLVGALERVHAGEVVVSEEEDPRPGTGAWPGRELGLSEREAEIVALITQGLSNEKIADRAYLSINTVKSYIRTAYRKMGVSSRSQAVLWGIDHGFRPDRTRGTPTRD